MNKLIHQVRINNWLLILTIFFYPISLKICNGLIILLTVHWLWWFFLEPNLLKEKLKEKLIWIMIFPFILVAVSLLYSQDKNQAFFILEKRLPMLLFPIIIGSIPTMDTYAIKRILFSACFGVFVSLVICLSFAIFMNDKTSLDRFFWSELIKPIKFHPSYLSLYLNILIVWLILYSNKIWEKSSTRLRAGLIMTIMIFYLFLFLLASKSQLIFGLMIPIVMGLYYSSKRITAIVFLFYLIIAIAAFFVGQKNNIGERFLHIKSLSYKINDPIEYFNELTMRFALLECSWQIIKQNPIVGVGAGDSAAELYKTYQRLDFKPGINSHLNPHNEYITELLYTGVIGLITLLITFFTQLRIAINRKDLVHGAFLFLLISNFAFESMLELQKGIVLFALFGSLFTFHGIKTQNSYQSKGLL